MATLTKDARLETRLTQTQRSLIERAAQLHGMSLSDFVVVTLQSAAEDTVRSHELLNLSRRDQELFVETLLNPPEANKALKKAFALEGEEISPSQP